jgi:hypothetical protein
MKSAARVSALADVIRGTLVQKLHYFSKIHLLERSPPG